MSLLGTECHAWVAKDGHEFSAPGICRIGTYLSAGSDFQLKAEPQGVRPLRLRSHPRRRLFQMKHMLIIVVLLFVVTSCTEKKADKTIKLELTIDAWIGRYWSNAPEVVWYRNDVQESSEFVGKEIPTTITHQVTYQLDTTPVYRAVVNIRDGHGAVKKTRSTTFDLARGETVQSVKF